MPASRTLLAIAAAPLLLVMGCASTDASPAAPSTTQQGSNNKAHRPEPREIPALGKATRARVPADALQAVLVTGDDKDSSRSMVFRYTRDADGWKLLGDPWPSHTADKGWTDHHEEDDLRSPIGVFGLTDAGGLLDNPGTKLPYDHNSQFTISGKGIQGEPLDGSFDYVIAINYNRKAGMTPLDPNRPMGKGRGGGIWIHVDHNGPTHGCVSVSRDHMRELLRWLDPAKKPVVIMGDETALSR
ncbi:L,D-transpeptidase family protein [Streptomyces sp. NBC_01210]|uniref:L,D-transpeptidase family protein n=1 Tax=Streptomyces sp. NBC_01210 TaxID=2903774 RepID=UPI002E1456B9|nr:L,D-transpeptidase family protein [Streptomyces sp. NBC_01210]